MITGSGSASEKARKGSSGVGITATGDASECIASTRSMLACSASAGERSPAR